MTDATLRPLIPAKLMTDDQLRRELADTHRLAALMDKKRCLPGQRRALSARLAELDTEYLHRYPHAANSWPWPNANPPNANPPNLKPPNANPPNAKPLPL